MNSTVLAGAIRNFNGRFHLQIRHSKLLAKNEQIISKLFIAHLQFIPDHGLHNPINPTRPNPKITTKNPNQIQQCDGLGAGQEFWPGNPTQTQLMIRYTSIIISYQYLANMHGQETLLLVSSFFSLITISILVLYWLSWVLTPDLWFEAEKRGTAVLWWTLMVSRMSWISKGCREIRREEIGHQCVHFVFRTF
jgi:hypothetical protein